MNRHQTPLLVEQSLLRLMQIMDDLRAKCPWDQKQTFETLRHLTIEEVYELADAILKKDLQEIKKELGDILLHLVFYAKIAQEQQAFDLKDVIDGICEKLIYRHPHIYADVVVKDEAEVKANWETLKLKEGKKSVLEGVPKALPAMVKAMRIQEKARGVGFDWDTREQVFEKIKEEIAELEIELQENQTTPNEAKIADEFGDLLFAMVNYARFIGVNPEQALEQTNQKFIDRFQYIEQKAHETQRLINALSLAEMEEYWQEAKTKLNKNIF